MLSHTLAQRVCVCVCVGGGGGQRRKMTTEDLGQMCRCGHNVAGGGGRFPPKHGHCGFRIDPRWVLCIHPPLRTQPKETPDAGQADKDAITPKHSLRWGRVSYCTFKKNLDSSKGSNRVGVGYIIKSLYVVYPIGLVF